MEIEQLHLMKDKAKPPNSFIDKRNNFSSNQPSLVTLNQQSPLSDPLSYADVGHMSPIAIAPMRLDEADCEENISEEDMTMYLIASIRIVNFILSLLIW
jgi:hypothetical protein